MASGRWKAADELGSHLFYKMIMTGTPYAKDLTQGWAQLKWLDPNIIGIKYISSFRNEYCIMGGFEGRAIIGTKNLERWQAKIEPYMIRTTAEEAGVLPKTYETWRFSLTASQKSMMKQMKQDLLIQIESGEVVDAANAAVAVMKMQQLANGFAVEKVDIGGGKFKNVTHRLFPDNRKNPRMIALTDYLGATEGKVVVWARFREDIKMIKEVLGDGCVTYYGADSDGDRVANLQRFLADPGSLYFVSNPQVGGTGLDGLQTVTHNAVYYSNSDNSIQRWQSEDRISRMEAIGGAILTDLVAISSPDTKILNNLKQKKAFSDMALGDIRKWLEEFDTW